MDPIQLKSNVLTNIYVFWETFSQPGSLPAIAQASQPASPASQRASQPAWKQPSQPATQPASDPAKPASPLPKQVVSMDFHGRLLRRVDYVFFYRFL